jgi:hypothetical protein
MKRIILNEWNKISVKIYLGCDVCDYNPGILRTIAYTESSGRMECVASTLWFKFSSSIYFWLRGMQLQPTDNKNYRLWGIF